MRLGHVLLFCLLWVPLEALVAAVTASSLGAFGEVERGKGKAEAEALAC